MPLRGILNLRHKYMRIVIGLKKSVSASFANELAKRLSTERYATYAQVYGVSHEGEQTTTSDKNTRSPNRKQRTRRNTNNRLAKSKNTPPKRELKYKSFLKSKYWLRVRDMVIERDGNACTTCKATKHLVVHHKTYKHHGDEENNLSDLITLCSDCHESIHDLKRKKKEERIANRVKKDNV